MRITCDRSDDAVTTAIIYRYHVKRRRLICITPRSFLLSHLFRRISGGYPWYCTIFLGVLSSSFIRNAINRFSLFRRLKQIGQSITYKSHLRHLHDLFDWREFCSEPVLSSTYSLFITYCIKSFPTPPSSRKFSMNVDELSHSEYSRVIYAENCFDTETIC